MTLIGRSSEPRVASAPRASSDKPLHLGPKRRAARDQPFETASLYANPKLVPSATDAARRLAPVLDADEADIRTKLSSGKSFVWLRRNLTPKQQYEVNRLGIPGVDFQRDERRVYPLSNITAHVVASPTSTTRAWPALSAASTISSAPRSMGEAVPRRPRPVRDARGAAALD